MAVPYAANHSVDEDRSPPQRVAGRGPAIYQLQNPTHSRSLDHPSNAYQYPYVYNPYYTYAHSSNTLTIRRLVLRPFSMLLFGYCLVQVLERSQHRLGIFFSSSTDCGGVWNTNNKNRGEHVNSNGAHSKNPAYLLPQPEPTFYMQPASRHQTFAVPMPNAWGPSQPNAAFPKQEEDLDDENEAINSDAADPNGAQLYGWEPSMYPDPLQDPLRCGILYVEHQQQQQQQQQNNSSLRLCDPDWVLGAVYLEEIAMAMQNFSNLFSDPIRRPLWYHGGGGQRMLEQEMGFLRFSRSLQYEKQPQQPQVQQQPQQPEQQQVEATQDDSVEAPSNDELGNQQEGKDQEELVPEESEAPPPPLNKNNKNKKGKPKPVIELAVATVRKVSFPQVVCVEYEKS